MDLGTGRRISYVAARRLLFLTGIVVLATTAVVLFARRVETTEVVAAILFLPVYVAVVAGKARGGLIAALIASVLYSVLRFGGTDALDRGEQVALVVSRSAAYLVFGAVGGAAVALLEASLVKLDRYDVIDDETGLHNARFIATELELELARAARYGSSFSLLLLEWSVEPIRRLSRSRRAALLTALGPAVRELLRTVDRPGIVRDDDRLRLAVVMPETPSKGVAIAGERLEASVRACLDDHQAAPDAIRQERLIWPEDETEIRAARARFTHLDELEHPEHPLAPA